MKIIQLNGETYDLITRDEIAEMLRPYVAGNDERQARKYADSLLVDFTPCRALGEYSISRADLPSDAPFSCVYSVEKAIRDDEGEISDYEEIGFWVEI